MTPTQTVLSNDRLYNGKELQDGTNWLDYGARMYYPELGRWMAVDPLPDTEGQESSTPYGYVFNNPAGHTDPDGRIPHVVAGAIAGGLIGGAIEAGRQVWNEGKVSDWRAVGGAAIQGAITGGAAAATGGVALANGGLSYLATAGAAAGANVVGGAASNAIQGKPINAGTIGRDAAIGAVAGVGGKVLDKVLSKAEGIIYLRTNPKTGAEYVGQAKSATHFEARQVAHDTKLGVKHDYKIIDRAKPGTKLDVAEESAIRLKGGPTNKSNPNGKLENKRHQMSEERYRAAGGKIDNPN